MEEIANNVLSQREISPHASNTNCKFQCEMCETPNKNLQRKSTEHSEYISFKKQLRYH